MTVLNTRTLVDGKKNIVIQGDIDGGGAGGELTDAVFYDASTFANGDAVKLKKIWASLGDFQVELEWDQTTDAALWTLNAGEVDHDFSAIGGIPHPGGAGATGDIVITTLGVAASERGSIILWLQRS